MRLEISTDYAIRILRLLYTRNDEMLTAMEIAQATDITYPVFTKIANQLRQAGILKTTQGRYGGYVLGSPAHEISIYDVFLCMEGDLRINRCLENGELCAHGEHVSCKVHGLLHGLQDDLIKKLGSVSIADLA